jgi:ABC-2 type transport system ATP-binding protein
MSISVQGVVKLYGEQRALNDVSFEIGVGEVVGFLGPNGAGKSTMMKIITCYLPPDAGSVSVCGHNVMDEPLKVKSLVGYLPEHNPLYTEMYVKEYLQFIGGVHKIKNLNARVAEMIERVGLGPEQHKKIGALSKGYRQRVGLAQAIIHNPAVLILDEPTSGLDPNQLEDIRKLIAELGREKTVMLSTHIMQEVEAICKRIIIINKGKLVANEQAAELQAFEDQRQVIYVEFDKPASKSMLMKINGVDTVKELAPHTWLIESIAVNDFRPVVARFAQDNNLLVLTLRKEERSLEEVFKELTREKKA